MRPYCGMVLRAHIYSLRTQHRPVYTNCKCSHEFRICDSVSGINVGPRISIPVGDLVVDSCRHISRPCVDGLVLSFSFPGTPSSQTTHTREEEAHRGGLASEQLWWFFFVCWNPWHYSVVVPITYVSRHTGGVVKKNTGLVKKNTITSA